MPRLKVVWPKDGPKGSRPRRFWGGLSDIFTGKGPDMFLQHENSNTPITPERWGNWDGYHSRGKFMRERNNQMKSRGTQRYDPESREYVEWSIPTDWYGMEDIWNSTTQTWDANYPHFTYDECGELARQLRIYGDVDPTRFPPGSGWNNEGPDRFNNTHNWFWQEAHRLGENDLRGLHPDTAPSPFMRMSNYNPMDFNNWVWWGV